MTDAPSTIPGTQAPAIILAMLRAIGWTGDLRQIEVAVPKQGGTLSLPDYAESFRNLGILPHARRTRLSTLSQADLPCLIEDAEGRVGLVEKVSSAGVSITYEEAATPALSRDTRPILALTIAKPQDGAGMEAKPIQAFLARQKKSLRTIVALSVLINVTALISPLWCSPSTTRRSPRNPRRFCSPWRKSRRSLSRWTSRCAPSARG